jgi:hypothetical protein
LMLQHQPREQPFVPAPRLFENFFEAATAQTD